MKTRKFNPSKAKSKIAKEGIQYALCATLWSSAFPIYKSNFTQPVFYTIYTLGLILLLGGYFINSQLKNKKSKIN